MWNPSENDIVTAEQAAAEAAAAERLALYPNLEPDQFWFVVRASGYQPELLAWVAAMNDPGTQEEPNPSYNPVEWAQASAKLEFAKFFERDHPFVEAAREAIGLDPAELDALWAFGAG